MKVIYKTLLVISVVAALIGCGDRVVDVIDRCSQQEHLVHAPKGAELGTNIPYLRKLFDTYNDGYFHGRLVAPEISLTDDEQYMAATDCNAAGQLCHTKFNLKYVLAPRVADFTMLHEMCHIKTWNKDKDSLGVTIDHGRTWRACMLELDAEGAFREIIIDDYNGRE